MKVAPRLFRPFVMERPFYFDSANLSCAKVKRQVQNTSTSNAFFRIERAFVCTVNQDKAFRRLSQILKRSFSREPRKNPNAITLRRN